MVVYNIKISNENSQNASFAIFADVPDVAQAYTTPGLSSSDLNSQSDPQLNVCAWIVQTLPPNGSGLISLNMENYAWVCKDLMDSHSREADLVTVLPPRSCLLYKLLVENSIKKANGFVVTLRTKDDCPVLGLESMPNINIKPGSFAINSDSSFSSADQILVGIGKLSNTETDLVVPIAVWPAIPTSTILVRPNDQVLYVSRFIGVQGQVGMPQEAVKIDFSINSNNTLLKTASVTYDNFGKWSKPIFSL